MAGELVCVAAIDLHRLTIARPLQWNHANWPSGLVEQGLMPGRIIRQAICNVQDGHGYPHQTEDIQLAEAFVMLDVISEQDLYETLSHEVDQSVSDIFGGYLQEDRYVIEGARCRSLGSILEHIS